MCEKIILFLNRTLTVFDSENFCAQQVISIEELTFFDASCKHHDSLRVAFPAHPPEIVPSRMQRSLSYYELSR